jgi:hypothetical protein
VTDDPPDRPTDEQRFLPEMPVPGPPAVPPPVTPPPPGTPPPGSLKPSGSDSWRWYFAVYAFVGALIAGQIAVLVVSGIWVWLSDKTLTQLSDGPGFIVVASAINELFLSRACPARSVGATSACCVPRFDAPSCSLA